MKKTWLWLIILISPLYGQGILDQYIQYALKHNLVLQEKTYSYQKSIAALREARGLFLPSISIEARYTRAGGGRIIDIPVGDLVNPIYSTLNDLLTSAGQPSPFPTDLPNERIPFLREEEHETKLRVIQPVFQPALTMNYQIQSDLKTIAGADRRVYTRQLIADIKTAYFNCLKTGEIQNLLEDTRKLLLENIRVNESLYKNQKVTQAAVFRARAELYELEQNQAVADKQKELARSYFNFLLNKPLDSEIDMTDSNGEDTVPLYDLERGTSQALTGREELVQLKKTISIAGHQIDLSKTACLPGIALVADYGYQGEKYHFTREDDYWMASAVLSWNLFNGFQTHQKIQQSKIEKKRRETQLSNLLMQIQLQVREAYYNIQVSQKAILAAEEQQNAAQKTFQIIDRKYKEGMASQVEFIDARTTKTRSEVNLILARYDLHIRQAEWEKATAFYPIDSVLSQK